MVTRRRARPKQRVLPHIFDIPEGLEDLVHSDESEDIDEQGDTDDYVDGDEDDDNPTKKKKKKKKKKKRKKKKNKGKKKKNKKKDGDKKKKGRGKKKDRDRDNDKGKRVKTPSSFEIISQKIRTKLDGSQVVDVIVDVDKIGRADKYEFRVTMKDTGKTTVQGEQA